MSLFNMVDLGNKYNILSRSLTKSLDNVLLEDSYNYSEYKTYDIFLSHSSLDSKYIYALRETIREMGFTVYVDWIEDRELDRRNVNKETAWKLKKRMNACGSLFYVTSPNSSISKWMPWELGYFDGIKGRVAILPVFDTKKNTNDYKGQEYLSLYPFAGFERITNNKDSLWIYKDPSNSVNYSTWLKSENYKGIFI